MKKGPAIHVIAERMYLGRIARKGERREVRIMAIAENYAMVRLKGAMPYVASVKELEQLP